MSIVNCQLHLTGGQYRTLWTKISGQVDVQSQTESDRRIYLKVREESERTDGEPKTIFSSCALAIPRCIESGEPLPSTYTQPIDVPCPNVTFGYIPFLVAPVFMHLV